MIIAVSSYIMIIVVDDHIGVVGRMAAKPMVLPDTFNGEGSMWTDWKFHFNNEASVNVWDNDNKLQWLKVCLTGRVQRAIQLLPADSITSFNRTIKALDEEELVPR